MCSRKISGSKRILHLRTAFVEPKPIGEALTHLTIRLKECKNVMVDKIMKVGMFKQVLCKEIVFPLPVCIMGMDSMSGWRTLPVATCRPREKSRD